MFQQPKGTTGALPTPHKGMVYKQVWYRDRVKQWPFLLRVLFPCFLLAGCSHPLQKDRLKRNGFMTAATMDS